MRKIITLGDFLVDVALLTDADNEKEEDKNKVSLMTIHAAKGLEFKHIRCGVGRRFISFHVV